MKKFYVLVAAMCCAASMSFAQEAQSWTSGDCTVTFLDGVMTVSGEGAMADYEYYYNRPWANLTDQVTSVVIEEGVTAIGYNAFYDFGFLESFSIAKTVNTIMPCAFEACPRLTSVVIPEGVVSIGIYAFQTCDQVTKAYLPSTLGYIGKDAFHNCTELTDVYCSADPEQLVWNESQCDDFIRPAGSKTTRFHVPAQYLNQYKAFWSTGDEATDVNVTFVADIPYFWFSGETMVTFDGNNLLTVSALPGTNGRMEDYEQEENMPWFDVRDQVTSIVIEEGVTKIGENDFYLCTNVISCTCHATTPPTLNGHLFYFAPAEQIIYVPAEAVEAYRATWGTEVPSERIQPIGGDGIEEIVESRESKVERQKVLIDGELYILRDNHIFNAQGARVK